MNRFFSIFTLALILTLGIIIPKNMQAQPGGDGKIGPVVVGYITRQLELTETEAQKFWPIFNEYEKEMRQTRKAYKDDELKMEEEMLKVRKSYKVRFLAAGISDQKINKLFKVEKELILKIQKAMQQRKEMREQRLRNGNGGGFQKTGN